MWVWQRESTVLQHRPTCGHLQAILYGSSDRYPIHQIRFYFIQHWRTRCQCSQIPHWKPRSEAPVETNELEKVLSCRSNLIQRPKCQCWIHISSSMKRVCIFFSEIYIEGQDFQQARNYAILYLQICKLDLPVCVREREIEKQKTNSNIIICMNISGNDLHSNIFTSSCISETSVCSSISWKEKFKLLHVLAFKHHHLHHVWLQHVPPTPNWFSTSLHPCPGFKHLQNLLI